MLLELVALDVERAVHRLDVVFLDVCVVAVPLLHLHAGKHAFLVEREVSGSLPEIRLADMRRIDDLVSRLVVALAPVVLNGDANARTARKPMREPGADGVGDREELEIAAKNTMVAALRLLKLCKIGIDFSLILADDSVQALEHLVLLVAAVVAARHLHELYCADLRRTLNMRATAHLGIVANSIGGNGLAGRLDISETLKLVLLPSEHSAGFIHGDILLDERLIKCNETCHLCLDFREILRRKPVLKVKIVVEPVLRRRPDIDLNVIEKVHDRARGQMGGGMTPHLIRDSHCKNLLQLSRVFYGN